MKTIYKYPIKITDVQYVDMPQEAKIIAAQMQGEQLCLWAEVESTYSTTPRRIEIMGTGNPFIPHSDNTQVRYIGTVQERIFVWHVYEVGV